MTDPLQHALHTAATSGSFLRNLAVFCGTALLFVQVAGFTALAVRHRNRLDWRLAARILVSGVVALVVTQVLVRVVIDPRPYMVEHYTPLAHVSADNGFPSDHTLVAALLTGWAAWRFRRAWMAFAAGVLLIALGRLGIGAHHTLDVLGSVLIALVSLGAAHLWPYPTAWANRPILPGLRPTPHSSTRK
ncbi:phosphatase PAP2 family protein [Deinococcus sp. KSM4-11]|uniref:phosphatase PAP2 family protein n=1 Tax=Deinococcus sp. KSM4-11 TaxID=2568654 RepID=UPI0010A3A585|nr:phosphatase PAP2 family protein [Deinococcus sp. KSM4-11]THF88510.1 phosphatase PAP2 family protein [Deinococcus sp. KSM4-11]